jgi:amidohydrolase
MPRDTQIARIRRAVAAEGKRIVQIGRFLHTNPEVAMAEFQAVERIAAYLADLGFAVTRPYAGLKTAFRAVLRGAGPGPTIGVCAEYDALPGLGHGCGHNLITVAALAAAAGVAGVPRNWRGTFEILGTPAEEGNCGKGQMVAAGAFGHLDCCYMTHPSNQGVIARGSLANRRATITFRGVAAHAAGAPEQGVNALDAAVLFFNAVNALRQQTREDARLHGILTAGGEATNVIPERAEVRYCARALDNGYLAELMKRVTRCARGAARAIGAKVSVRWNGIGYDPMRINRPLVEVLAAAFADAGMPLQVRSGVEGRGSLDMGNVSQVVPAAHPYFDIVPRGQAKAYGHTREFLRLADTPAAYRKALQAGTAMALAARRLFANRKKLTGIKRAFRV